MEHKHEDFIRYLQEQEAKRLEESGKPFKMIECDSEEIKKENGNDKKLHRSKSFQILMRKNETIKALRIPALKQHETGQILA